MKITRWGLSYSTCHNWFWLTETWQSASCPEDQLGLLSDKHLCAALLSTLQLVAGIKLGSRRLSLWADVLSVHTLDGIRELESFFIPWRVHSGSEASKFLSKMTLLFPHRWICQVKLYLMCCERCYKQGKMLETDYSSKRSYSQQEMLFTTLFTFVILDVSDWYWKRTTCSQCLILWRLWGMYVLYQNRANIWIRKVRSICFIIRKVVSELWKLFIFRSQY